MNTLLKNTLRALGLIAVATALSACNSTAPSASDAKAAVQARLGECKYFSVDSVTKLNGIPLDDNDYHVEVKYTISLKPDSDLKDSMQAYSTMYTHLLSLRQTYNLHKAALETLHANDTSYDPTDDLASDKTAADAVAAQLNANGGQRRFQKAIKDDCPGMRVSPAFLYTYFGQSATLDQLIDGETAEFHETMAMIKTDNGWQELQ